MSEQVKSWVLLMIVRNCGARFFQPIIIHSQSNLEVTLEGQWKVKSIHYISYFLVNIQCYDHQKSALIS